MSHVEQETELRVVRKREHDDKVERRAEIDAVEDRLHRISQELANVARARDLAETQLAETRSAATAREGELSTKVASLDEQNTSRGETVARLEQQLVAQYDARALAQQNEELKAAIQTYKNQIASLNHTVAALRVEADTFDNHSTRALQEANAGCLRRIAELQDRVERQEHLLADCVPLTEALEDFPHQLRKDMSTWRRQRTGEPGADLLASRDARPQPLPPPHAVAGTGVAAARSRPAAEV